MLRGCVDWEAVLGRGRGRGQTTLDGNPLNNLVDGEALWLLLEKASFCARSAKFYVARLSGSSRDAAVASCAEVSEALEVLRDVLFSDGGETAVDESNG